MIAPFINDWEYRCPCCHDIPKIEGCHEHLFRSFQNIRDRWGRPILINSGFRCVDYNKLIGGSDLSLHMFGLALDLECRDDVEVEALYDCIDEVNHNLRIGTYYGDKTFIHIDVAYLVYPGVKKSWTPGFRWTN